MKDARRPEVEGRPDDRQRSGTWQRPLLDQSPGHHRPAPRCAVLAPPVPAFRTGLRAETVTILVLALATLSGVVVGLEVLRPVHVVNLGTRAGLETAITLSAILGACGFVAVFRQSRHLLDLLLAGAVVAAALADFAYSGAPSLTGRAGLESGGAARLAGDLVVALAFATAAFAPRRRIAGSGRSGRRGSWPDLTRRPVLWAVGAGAVMVMLAELLVPVAGPDAVTVRVPAGGLTAALDHPVALAIHITSAVVLIAAAVAFLLRSGRRQIEGRLVAGAAFLLAGAMLQYLAIPAAATDWVTPREGLRLAAYALLLGTAYHRYTNVRRQKARAALSSERERIARDLHDGLAQDLACIAAQGQRLESELGPQHPLMIATRHALAASRGSIADLTASTAPTTEAALRLVANELEHRFDLVVEVRIETNVPMTADNDLEPTQREHVIRIAREGIVNAALHGNARHVDVVVDQKGRDLLMRVSDDGHGITDAHRPGFGLRTMRARAASLGGRVDARPRADGGTELELVVS